MLWNTNGIQKARGSTPLTSTIFKAKAFAFQTAWNAPQIMANVKAFPFYASSFR